MDIYYILYIYYIQECQDILEKILTFEYICFMATKNPKILITLNEKLIDRLDDYRYENRIPSRSEAIRKLLDDALKRYENKSK